MNDRIIEFEKSELMQMFEAKALREGDTLLMAHARVLGRAKEREKWLTLCAVAGVLIKLPGHMPAMYDTPEKKAVFHAEAVQPTGRPSAKQKKNRGRPKKYPDPKPEHRSIICGWWCNPMSDGKYMKLKDVQAGAEQLVGHPVSRDYLKNLCGKSRGKIETEE
ncbi:hypothetical protein [uncultured Tateyamaria sp.]|uniref:hypothetical protein n=1 Tax=Tateyamaria sp. 1078 TaxID=3417464 RepID=UPI00261552D4|nr:hypothetical protein [uncultured Tateyamaria sp.]